MKTDQKHYLFLDAETDGLYGSFLSVAAIICDSKGRELSSFYHYVDLDAEDISEPWVRENVFPYLKQEGVAEASEESLIESFCTFFLENSPCICIGDVTYPVECRLFESCFRNGLFPSVFSGPYPLLDLSSMLYCRGIDPLAERLSLVQRPKKYHPHNALDDVRIAIDIWKTHIIV